MNKANFRDHDDSYYDDRERDLCDFFQHHTNIEMP